MRIIRNYGSLVVAVLFLTCLRCDIFNLDLEAPPTTKEKMMGVWEVTEATDDKGASILKEINFPITAFHLTDANSVHSTAGPMFMEIVYGRSKYTKIASKVDEVFKYTGLQWTDGEWFIEGGYPDRFTIEMKLEGFPGQKTLTELLDLIGITKDYLDATIYHKFIDVKVSFPGTTDSLMAWEFDYTTTAAYNIKNSKGNYVAWEGWPTESFGRFTFVLTKRVKTLQQLIQGANERRDPQRGITHTWD